MTCVSTTTPLAMPKGRAEHDVGRLAADAGQLHQLVHGRAALRRRAPPRASRSSLDVLGFVAKEAGALDQLLQLADRHGGEGRRRRILANRSLVTMFTRSSVHWAERIVAISSSNGESWTSALGLWIFAL